MKCVDCGIVSEKVIRKRCPRCYQRALRAGAIVRETAHNHGKTCQFSGCDRPAHAKGLCAHHYEKSDHPLKTLWRRLRSRAVNGDYPEKWERFDEFLTDVGERPSPKHSLHRFDPEKPFSAENVHWLAPVTNNRKRLQREDPNYDRAWQFKRKYGITLADYDTLLNKQGGVCAICGKAETHIYKSGQIKGLAVDHDHKAGKVRGLLCFNCNTGIGLFRDDPKIIQSAITYLAGK